MSLSRSRSFTSLVWLSAMLYLAPSRLLAQGGGGEGGGGGGGGFSGGGLAQAPRLVQSDVSGPPAVDSVRSGLKLDSTIAAGYAAALRLHLQATAALRDSVGRSAEATGLARAKMKSSAPIEEQAILAVMLDKLVKRVRKADDEFLDTQVKLMLTRDQLKTFKKWLERERNPPMF